MQVEMTVASTEEQPGALPHDNYEIVQNAFVDNGLQAKIQRQDQIAAKYARTNWWLVLPAKFLPFVASVLFALASFAKGIHGAAIFVAVALVLSVVAGVFAVINDHLQLPVKAETARRKASGLRALQRDLPLFCTDDNGRLIVADLRMLNLFARQLREVDDEPLSRSVQ